jgi:hypothetical protein
MTEVARSKLKIQQWMRILASETGQSFEEFKKEG